MDIINTLESDATAVVNFLETGASAIAKAIGGTLLGDLEQLLEQELQLLVTAGLDLATGLPVDTLLTNVLNAAGAAGKQAITQIPNVALNAAVSVFAAVKTAT